MLLALDEALVFQPEIVIQLRQILVAGIAGKADYSILADYINTGELHEKGEGWLVEVYLWHRQRVQ